MKKLLILSFLFVGLSGCLRNLNESEFFRKLEIKKESWYGLVLDYKSEFETSIEEYIENEYGGVKSITFWGEGRYACGKVVRKDYSDREVLQVLGVYTLEGQTKKIGYTIQFVPMEQGKLDSPNLY